MTSTTENSSTKRLRRMAREPKPQQDAQTVKHASDDAPAAQAQPAVPPRGPSKSDMVLALLNRPEGATLEQMVEATGWLPHTTRAVLTGFKKKGHAVTSEKVDGVRMYRAMSRADEPGVEPPSKEAGDA